MQSMQVAGKVPQRASIYKGAMTMARLTKNVTPEELRLKIISEVLPAMLDADHFSLEATHDGWTLEASGRGIYVPSWLHELIKMEEKAQGQ
jgi:hypothetical protein